MRPLSSHAGTGKQSLSLSIPKVASGRARAYLSPDLHAHSLFPVRLAPLASSRGTMHMSEFLLDDTFNAEPEPAHIPEWLETLMPNGKHPPTQGAQQWWDTFQATSEAVLPNLPPQVLCNQVLACAKLNLTPGPRWLRACLEALFNQLEQPPTITLADKTPNASATAAITTAIAQPEQVPATQSIIPDHNRIRQILNSIGAAETGLSTSTSVSAFPVRLLPRVLATIMDWQPGQQTQVLIVQSMSLLHPHVAQMQQQDLAHMVHVLVQLHMGGTTHAPDSQLASTSVPAPMEADGGYLPAPMLDADEGGLLQAVVTQVQRMSWTSPRYVGSLIEVIAGTAKLGVLVPAGFLNVSLRALTAVSDGRSPAAVVKGLDIDPILALTEGLLAYAAAVTPCGPMAQSCRVDWGDAPTATKEDHVTMTQQPPDESTMWLLGWGKSFAMQVFPARASQMGFSQLLKAAMLLNGFENGLAGCIQGVSQPLTTSQLMTEPDAAHSGPPPPPLCNELEASLREASVQVLGVHMLHLTACAAHLPIQTFHTCLTVCIQRLQRDPEVVSQYNPVQLLLNLAAAAQNIPDYPTMQPQWYPLLHLLLEASRPVLPSCQTQTLVHVISALAVLDCHPDQYWQAAYFCTLRVRLPLISASELHCVLGTLKPLKLTPDELWVNDVFSTSRTLLPSMDAYQVADLLWTLGEQAPCMDWLWAPAYEKASSETIKDLSPYLLAATAKSLTQLSYRPSQRWMTAFLDALQLRLFAPGAAQMCAVYSYDEGNNATEQTVDQHMDIRCRIAAESYCRQALASRPAYNEVAEAADGADAALLIPAPLRAAPGPVSAPPMTAWSVEADTIGHVSVDTLMTIIDALTYSRVRPRKDWMHDFMDAVRCKLSLLDNHQLASLLTFCATTAFVPAQEWWDDYLQVAVRTLRQSNTADLSLHLALLNSMGVIPSREWLAAWCAASQARLCLFMPAQIHQVLSCLAAAGYTPNPAWLYNAQTAVIHLAPQFEPSELLRCLVILERMGTSPSAAVMQLVFSPHGCAGLRSADPAVLAQLVWLLQGPMTLPESFPEWLEAYTAAARLALPQFTPSQLESAMSGLIALSQTPQQKNQVAAFLVQAREWTV